MRKQVLAIGLSLMFFGSIATSTFGMTVTNGNNIVIVDKGDDDKKAKKSKKSKSDCDAKKSSECCDSKKASTCDDKKGEDKK